MDSEGSDSVREWRTDLLGREYDYVTQSSFHSDELRNQYIQFYILLVSIVLSAGIALIQFKVPVHPAVLCAVALLVGLVGVLEVGVFVRLRVVVIECLQATVLLKEYALRGLPAHERDRMADAFLWDTETLPNPLYMWSASSLLMLLVIVLDSAMFAGAAYTATAYGRSAAVTLTVSAAVWAASVLLQVLFYRQRLRAEVKHNRFAEKLARLKGSRGSVGQPVC
jgi:hypothetical protein